MNKTSPTHKAAPKAAKPVTKPAKAKAMAQPLMPLPADASTRKRFYDGGHSQVTSFKTDGSAIAILMASGRFHTMAEAINFALRSVVVNYNL